MSRWIKARETLREGVVIVISVPIALGVDAWWEERSDRAREESCLATLAVELDSLSAVIDAAAHDDSAYLQRTEAILRVLREDQPPTPRADSIAAILGLNYSIFDPPTGTLRLLATSDQSADIRSEEMRAALRAAEGALVRTETLLNRTETETWSLVQRGSPDLRGIHQDHLWVLQNRLGYLGSLQARTDRLRELVRSEVGPSATSGRDGARASCNRAGVHWILDGCPGVVASPPGMGGFAGVVDRVSRPPPSRGVVGCSWANRTVPAIETWG